jgi:selenocysteine lyase/cysteine desulfurase
MSSFTARLGDRSLFPSLEAKAYLAHAGCSPASSAVLDAVSECLARYAAGGIQAAVELLPQRRELRALAARLIGAAPEDIGLVQSTSAGVISIARAIPFRRGQRILLCHGEFPANITPWQLVAQDRELELGWLSLQAFERSNQEGLSLLRAELERGVRLVAVSAVQFQTGLRMPLREMAELCHAHGAELFVDAIQALGAVPLDVRDGDLDYVAAGGHKFLLGLEGAGLLYVRKRALAGLSLHQAGWTGHADPFRFLVEGPGQLRYDRPLVRAASFVEAGAVSVVGYAALHASLQILLSLGVENIFRHVTGYLDALEPELVALGCQSVRAPESERRSAILSVKLPPGTELAEVARALAAEGVIASTPDGHLRFAPHFSNQTEEIPYTVNALRGILSRRDA